MSYPELEEFASEDIGFQLVSGKDGELLFDEPIDFESVKDVPLQLLTVGHTKKIYAVSNTNLVAVGSLGDLDDLTTARLKLSYVAAALVSSLSFNSTNDTLYVVSESNVLSASVAEIQQGGASPFKQLISTGSVASFAASPLLLLSYFHLLKDKTLTIVHNGSLSTLLGVNAASWHVQGHTLGVVYDEKFLLVDANGNTVLSEDISGCGTLNAISCADSQNWLLVGAEEDADSTNILVNVVDNTVKSTSLVPVPPPFGEAERAATLYSTSLIEWAPNSSFAFLTSALSTDVSTVEVGTNERYITQLNDTDRAELPMDDDSGDDTLPVGFSVDLSGTHLTVKEPCQAVEVAVGVLPRLLCLNNLGRLLVWYVFDSSGLKNETLSLTRALESLTNQLSSQTESAPVKTEPAAASSTSSEQTSKPTSGTTTGFGTSGFGSTGFGKAAFGSSGFGASTSQPSASGFGSSSFGSSNDNKSTQETKSNNTGFGSGATFGKPSFGTDKPVFGASSSFGSSGFGSSGFGNKPTTTSASNFGSYGNTSASFLSAKSSDSPFGAVKSSSDSPFGAVKTSSDSPFGAVKSSSDSPFGAVKSTSDSPFGAVKSSSDSPFGSTKSSTDSPFGSTKPSTSSPFGSFKPSTSSPFGSTTTSTQSPFDSLKQSKPEQAQESTGVAFGSNKPSTESPFATLTSSKGLPFGSKTASDTNDDKSKDINPFGSSQPFTSLKLSESTTKEEEKPSFGSAPKESEKPSLFGGAKAPEKPLFGNATQSNDKPALFGSAVKESEKAPLFGGTTKVSERVRQLQGQSESSSPFPVPSDNKDSKSKETQPGPFSFGLSKLTSDNSSPFDILKSSKEQLPASDSKKIATAESESLDEAGGQNLEISESDSELGAGVDSSELSTGEDSPQEDVLSDGSQTPFGAQTNEKDDASPTFVPLIERAQETPREESKLPEIPATPVAPPQIPDIQAVPLSTFSGWTSEPPKLQSEIPNKITSLVQTSEALTTILEGNAEILKKLLEDCAFSAIKLNMEDLQDPNKWTLGVIDTLNQLSKEVSVDVKEHLSTLKKQDESLSNLMELVGESETLKEQLVLIISQIALFKQELESEKVMNRPLDVESQVMRYRLRRKLELVRKKQDEALQSMVQLSMRQKVNLSYVKKLGEVVYEIHTKAKQHNEDIEYLEHTLSKLTERQLITENGEDNLLGDFTNFKEQKWNLASKFAGNKHVRQATITQI